MANDATLEEVDSIMAELGLSTEPTNQSRPGTMRSGKASITEDEVDQLMAEIGVAAPTPGVATSGGVASPGPGPGRGRSAGPGPNWAGRGRSAGPGPGFARGASAGPGPGLARGASPSPAPAPAAPAADGGAGRGFATHTPDGRAIIHQGPPCAHCGEIIVGQCLNALGKTFHPEHFVCTHCNLPFPKGVFVEHEGNPYCEADFNELFCPRCANCKQPIIDKCVTAIGNKYHAHHFTCTGCGRNLVGQQYKEEEGDVYCTGCKEARKQRIVPAAETCARCKRPIIGEYITLHGQRMHPEHFRCEECGCEFRGGNCHEYEGKLYCQEDYNKLLRNTCASCHKPIQGRSVTALGRVWHPEHFVCFTCHEPFAGSNFYEHEGKPYCEAHYTQNFGLACAKCNRPVVHNVIHFLDKVYHEEHFVCTGCDRLLKKGDITEWEAKPMCMGCYKKLPEDIRKRVEKKRNAEKKLAEQRAKDEKKALKKENKTK